MSRLTIYKYQVSAVSHQVIAMPIGARLLSVHARRESVFLWALVDPSLAHELVGVRLVGTGKAFDAIDDYPHFIGTVQIEEGPIVFHVFSTHAPCVAHPALPSSSPTSTEG